MKFHVTIDLTLFRFVKLLTVLLAMSQAVSAQTIVFDDFTYTGTEDPALGSFNRWTIINGTDGPPAGALYKKTNVTFTPDPENSSNTLLGLSSSNTNTVNSTTHARLQSIDMNYGPGTYAARVFFDNSPIAYKDPIIQTFYTITSYQYADKPNLYAEIDFEYLPYDAWSGDYGGGYNNGMFMTSWESATVREHELIKDDFGGWHTLIFSYVDGKVVRFYIDGALRAEISITSDGTSVYPDNTQFVSFANWVYTLDKAVLGPSSDTRSSTMKVDWFVHIKNEDKTPVQVQSMVDAFRAKGIQRQNLSGETYTGVTAIEEQPENLIAIYPNPAKNELRIKSPHHVTGGTIEIYSSLLQRVYEGKIENDKVNITALPTGIYLVLLKAGKLHETRKLLIIK